MIKPWSITTALRNPERIRGFLAVLKQLEGYEWKGNPENQKKYQMLLIQTRLYGYRNQQFYKGLSQDMIDLIDDPSQEITFEQAEEIFNTKNYEDPAMRGRQSINMLKKMGFAAVEDGKVKITGLGNLFLADDFDLGEIFFRSLLKWQIPFPGSKDYPDNGDYNIKPFVGTLHLIDAVNQREIARGNDPKGISKREFSLFAPTLLRHIDIKDCADKIVALRDQLKGNSKQKQKEILDAYEREFAQNFLGTDDKDAIDKQLRNLRDYGDSAIRYFRLTRYITIRGGGFYIDLEPRRSIETESLLSYDDARAKRFKSEQEYLNYISDITQPQLPWETKEKYSAIAEQLISEIREYESSLGESPKSLDPPQGLDYDQLKDYVTELRTYRRQLQDEESHRQSQTVDQIRSCIDVLDNIFKYDNRPLLLEKQSSFGLLALNDALQIQPNYPVGDDNEPTFTAPANTPDIECYYDSFNAICEVTMLQSRDQWYNEGQPVMRHLRDFEDKNDDKPVYCLFIAPKIHRDTLNTFWYAVQNGYEGKLQKIIPLSISQYTSILKVLLQMKTNNQTLSHTELARLYDAIIQSAKSCKDSIEWIESIPYIISAWQKSLLDRS